MDGSGVAGLRDQAGQAAEVEPTPDLVLVQSIDNDIKCDGTDAKNYGPYFQSLTQVLDALTHDLPEAEIFFVSQWANLKEYDRVASRSAPTTSRVRVPAMSSTPPPGRSTTSARSASRDSSTATSPLYG